MKANRNKLLGRYYTPRPISDALVTWAIRHRETKLLDPSFGGCSLLHAAVQRLKDLGAQKPGRYVFGVDIDRGARAYLGPILKEGGIKSNFLISDFLDLTPEEMPGAPFQAICGNPPFVRYNLLPRRKLRAARESVRKANVSVPRTSSYWIYFLIHSLQFLAPGSRLAMVLPTASLYSDYSRSLWSDLETRFGCLSVISLNGLLFDGAEEAVVLLLADGFLSKGHGVQITLRSGLLEPHQLSRESRSEYLPLRKACRGEKEWTYSLVSPDALRIYETVAMDSRVSSLGDWVDIKIGVVTGYNDFFVLRESQRKEFSVPRCLVHPVVTHASDMTGLEFREADLDRILLADKPSHLLNIRHVENLPSSVREYIHSGARKGAHKRFKCRHREKWYVLNDVWPPDAFINYMCLFVPHLALNRAAATCTNSIHRARFRREMSKRTSRSLAVAFLSSLTQLSIELVGRSYGAGVLKLEPSEAKRVLVAVPPATAEVLDSFRRIDGELRSGRKLEAVAAADEVILQDYLQLERSEIAELNHSWRTLARIRTQRGTRCKSIEVDTHHPGSVAPLL